MVFIQAHRVSNFDSSEAFLLLRLLRLLFNVEYFRTRFTICLRFPLLLAPSIINIFWLIIIIKVMILQKDQLNITKFVWILGILLLHQSSMTLLYNRKQRLSKFNDLLYDKVLNKLILFSNVLLWINDGIYWFIIFLRKWNKTQDQAKRYY